MDRYKFVIVEVEILVLLSKHKGFQPCATAFIAARQRAILGGDKVLGTFDEICLNI
jgi:hypothetical protein